MRHLDGIRIRNTKHKTGLVVSDPLQTASELGQILINLRHYTREWEQRYGSDTKNRKKYWEEKADKYLESIEKK